MKTKYKAIILSVLFILIGISNVYSASLSTKVRVYAIKGKVTTQLIKGKQESKVVCYLERKLDVTESRIINREFKLKTGDDSFALIEYTDHSKIKIAPNTTVIISRNNIYIPSGETWFKIEKIKSGKLVIKTPTAIAGIRGTEFIVKVKKDKTSTIKLIKGKIKISDIHKKSNINLTGGMEVTVAPRSSTLNSNLLKIKEQDKWWTNWPKLVPISKKPGYISGKVTNTGENKIKAVADAYVYAYNYRNWNRSNRGKYEQLVAGWHPVGGESRIYIRFELPDFSLGKTEKVYLRLYHFSTSGNSNVDLGVYRVGDPWKEGRDTYHPGKIEKTATKDVITWKHQPVFNSSVIASFNPGTKQNHWVDVDITVLVREWQAGFKNYGLVIKPVGNLNSSNPESLYHFASREYENGSKQPVLVVTKAKGNTVSVNNQISNTKIVGDWKWFTGDLVHIYKNRTVKSPNGSHGTWKTSHDGSKLIYIINWENGRYIDKLVLKGNTLDGHNQNGTHVWGKRIKQHKLKSGAYHVKQGHWESTWRLKVEKNGKITGTSEWTCCPNHRVDPLKGRITGNTVKIIRDCSGQGYSGACNQTYKGKIVGDRIEGTCSGTGLSAGSTWVLYLIK